MNSPMQGSAADLIKIAMIRLATGLSADQLARLPSADIRITDLNGQGALGLAGRICPRAFSAIYRQPRMLISSLSILRPIRSTWPPPPAGERMIV